MPSTNQSGTTSGDRERFPDVSADIGEDPARFLDKPLAPPRQGETTPMALAWARIRGIDFLVVVARWLEVEHQLARGPRESVVKALEQRGQELKTHGERDLPGISPAKLRARAEALPSTSVAEWPDREGNERSVAFVSGSPFSRERVSGDGGEES